MAFQATQRLTRRTSLLTLAALTGGTLLAACGEPAVRYVGKPQAGPAGPAGPQGPKGEAGAKGKAGAPGAPGKAPVVLEHIDWWRPRTPVLIKYFEGIKKDFETLHPNVTINYTFIRGTLGVREKWIVLTAGGTPPDSSQVSVNFIRDLMEANLVEPLDSYMARTPHMSLDKFVDSGRFFNTYKGKHYGVPYDGPATNTIAYNTEHFQEIGLDPSRKFTWHWTYDQFLEAAKKLVKSEGGRAVRGGMRPPGLSITGLLPWLYANGGVFYNKDYTRVLLNDDKGRGALQFMVDLRHRHKLTSDVDGAGLENGGYAMILSGSWTAGYILDKNPQLQFGYAPIPQGPLGTHPASQTWTNMWSMSRGGKKKDTAWQWLSFVNSEETLEKYFAGVLKRISGRKAFYQSAAWKTVLKDLPQLEGIEKIAEMSGPYPWVKTAAVRKETKDVFKKVQDNQMGVNDALNELERIVNHVLSGA